MLVCWSCPNIREKPGIQGERAGVSAETAMNRHGITKGKWK
jgi:hypothetical protein